MTAGLVTDAKNLFKKKQVFWNLLMSSNIDEIIFYKIINIFVLVWVLAVFDELRNADEKLDIVCNRLQLVLQLKNESCRPWVSKYFRVRYTGIEGTRIQTIKQL